MRAYRNGKRRAALGRFAGEPAALVFEAPAEPERLATRLSADLKLAGITRAELFERSDRAWRFGCTICGLLVTIALAAGKP